MYDSTKDTREHQERVAYLIGYFSGELHNRALEHDDSKLEEPEKSIFDEFTPKLKETTYWSDEYKGYLEQMQVALKHHYTNNRHHAECHENGISGMNLVDIVEMICDWKAASERHADGDIMKSIKINKERFGYSDELESILKNTAELLSRGRRKDVDSIT